MNDRLPALPNAWNLYNLEASPFFQDTLEATEHSSRPLDHLFVGRGTELNELRGRVHASGARGTRQAVGGKSGVGKTTLVQELKAALFKDGYLTTDSLVPLLPEDTSEALLGRVLGMLYDTILANRPQTVGNPVMQDAQILVRATRLRSSTSAGVSMFGFGLSGGGGTSALSAADILIDGPRIMRDLMRLVQDSGARGVVIHVNNLESLGEADASRAAEILRGLRDPMLMHDALHFVVVGTADAVNTIVNTHAQVRNIFSIVALEPMSVSEVHALLRERYNYLQRDAGVPVQPPVAAEAVEALYALYAGDLRGTLKALEDGVTPLLGLVGTEVTDDGIHARPLRLEELRPVLRQRYAAHLASLPEHTRVDQLMAWGDADPGALHTQESLQGLWGIKQPSVSLALKYLIQQGYVVAMPREGKQPIRYGLSGTGQLIFQPS